MVEMFMVKVKRVKCYGTMVWNEENVPEERNSNYKGKSKEYSKNCKSCIMKHGVGENVEEGGAL